MKADFKLNIKKDDWLSEQLIKPTYQLDTSKLFKDSFFQIWNQFITECGKMDFFVFSKVSTEIVEAWQLLEGAGFRLIDTNVQFENKDGLLGTTNPGKLFNISFAEDEHKNAVKYIARNNFVYSRFHLDSQIDNIIADQIKQNWVENYFFGKRGNSMVIAVLNDVPIGFLQLIIKNGVLLIDLICVEQKNQGQGVASAMIKFASQNIDHTCIKVGTQIGNKPSIKLYHKLGFDISSSSYVFHYHSQ